MKSFTFFAAIKRYNIFIFAAIFWSSQKKIVSILILSTFLELELRKFGFRSNPNIFRYCQDLYFMVISDFSILFRITSGTSDFNTSS